VWCLNGDFSPGENDILAFLEAYFDESGTHDRSPVMCVSGYLFEKSRRQELDQGWKAVLDKYSLPFFHMVDCAHHQHPFDALPKPDCDLVARQMISLIRNHASFGMGVALVESDYNQVMSGMPRIQLPDDSLAASLPGSAYSYCCWTALNAIGAWLQRTEFAGDVAYFFEAGHKHGGEADQIMHRLARVPSLRKTFRYSGHAFVLKEKVRAIQTADILAWHHATDVKKILSNKPRRKDYAALIDGRDVEMKFVTRAQLTGMRAQMEALIRGEPIPAVPGSPVVSGTFGSHRFTSVI
jgi:hypothetical protein